MMKTIYKASSGQEAIEFILISVLVFMASLITIFLLGQQLANFFQTDSAVAKTAGQETPVISAASDVKYSPDYITQVDTMDQENRILTADGFADAPQKTVPVITDADLKNLLLNTYPDDLQTTINTTGASGGTDDIASVLEQLAAYIEAIKQEYPDDPALQEMSSIAYKMADKGYLVSDCEEWFEYAADRLNSSSTLKLPADNRICEFGEIKGTGSCDDSVATDVFFFTDVGRGNIETNMKTQMNDMIALRDQLQQITPPDDPRVSQIAATIASLTDEIQQISENVSAAAKELDDYYDANQKAIEYKKYLNSKVASRTTNIKSYYIEKHGDDLQETSSSEPITNEPVDTTDSNI
jgi:hypothetical protein